MPNTTHEIAQAYTHASYICSLFIPAGAHGNFWNVNEIHTEVS